MATPTANDQVNDALVEIHRSLVQYVAEAWPWTTAHDQEIKTAVMNVARRQQKDVADLISFLQGRHIQFDFGYYPHAYTGFNYVSLEYLYSKLIEHQQQLVEYLESLGGTLADDAEAKAIIDTIATSQRAGLEELSAVKQPPVEYSKT